jgi:AcrR family transcriptional regulator
MKDKTPSTVARQPRKTRGGGDASRRAAVTGSRARKAEAITVEAKTKWAAPSLVQTRRQKRSEEIAAEAQISTRTFYRYCPTKEDVLQVRIRRRAEALRGALSERPADEPPLRSLRLAAEVAVSAEDPVLLKRWIAVVAATPSALRAVLGGCILTLDGMLAEFFSSRLSVPADDLVPTMLAGAAGGVIKAAETRWLLSGGNLATTISEGLRVLEEAVGAGLGTRTGGKGRRNNTPRA